MKWIVIFGSVLLPRYLGADSRCGAIEDDLRDAFERESLLLGSSGRSLGQLRSEYDQARGAFDLYALERIKHDYAGILGKLQSGEFRRGGFCGPGILSVEGGGCRSVKFVDISGTKCPEGSVTIAGKGCHSVEHLGSPPYKDVSTLDLSDGRCRPGFLSSGDACYDYARLYASDAAQPPPLEVVREAPVKYMMLMDYVVEQVISSEDGDRLLSVLTDSPAILPALEGHFGCPVGADMFCRILAEADGPERSEMEAFFVGFVGAHRAALQDREAVGRMFFRGYKHRLNDGLPESLVPFSGKETLYEKLVRGEGDFSGQSLSVDLPSLEDGKMEESRSQIAALRNEIQGIVRGASYRTNRMEKDGLAEALEACRREEPCDPPEGPTVVGETDPVAALMDDVAAILSFMSADGAEPATLALGIACPEGVHCGRPAPPAEGEPEPEAKSEPPVGEEDREGEEREGGTLPSEQLVSSDDGERGGDGEEEPDEKPRRRRFRRSAPGGARQPPPPAAQGSSFERQWAMYNAASYLRGRGLLPTQQHQRFTNPMPDFFSIPRAPMCNLYFCAGSSPYFNPAFNPAGRSVYPLGINFPPR